MYIFTEAPSVASIPTNIKKFSKKDYIRMECILQTAGDVNKNKRMYSKSILESGMQSVLERIKEGSFLGELDHPVDTKPQRQVTVLFKDAAHRILEYGWEKNNLISVVETLDTPNGHILRNLALQGVPVGYSFRGMGELKQVTEKDNNYFEVCGPLHVVTWDAVSNPSHRTAKVRKINESAMQNIYDYITENSEVSLPSLMESGDIFEQDGMVCKDGICYLPNQFDQLVEQKVFSTIDKYRIV